MAFRVRTRTLLSCPINHVQLIRFHLSILLCLPTTTVHAAQVTLAWDRNAESNVEGYKVYYGTASRDYDWFIDVGDVTSITITDLADGFTFYFAATAYDTATPPLESTYSDEVSKSTCTYSISPTNASFSASGGTGSVSVTTQAGCPWTASSGAAWMTITSGSSGSGNGTVNYSIASNYWWFKDCQFHYSWAGIHGYSIRCNHLYNHCLSRNRWNNLAVRVGFCRPRWESDIFHCCQHWLSDLKRNG